MTALNHHITTDVIGLVADQVERILATEGSGHDWQHIRRVWFTAAKLAVVEKADVVVVILAALLHDVDDRKLTGDDSTETLLPTARRILAEAGAKAALIETVCSTIKMTGFHKGLDGGTERSLEAHILSDADQLDAIGAIGVARTFVFGASRRRPMFEPDVMPMTTFTVAQYDANKGSTIAHFFEKLLKLRTMMATETGRREANVRHARMVDFLDAFFIESAAPAAWFEMLSAYRD
ncbi:HD domain-containing protein [Rhizobium leguminosarum]|uniref:HD domain-containing protein n=1 Tax=Rhizobium leguminosarum TaxID=384 RepID=UPI002E11D2DE|nr:HD domain-containing protein [Rhizobium leguminosarum]